MVPETRVRILNPGDVNPNGEFVLYWQITARRLGWNFALDRAVDLATELGKPLVIVEALRCDYPHASDRLHRFILDGMANNRRIASRTGAFYYPYVEPDAGVARGFLTALSERACAIVTDWYPAFFIPRMLSAAARKVSARLEAIDSNSLIPLAAHGKAFAAARFYRAFMQRTFREHVAVVPDASPLDRLPRQPKLRKLPADITDRWPPAVEGLLDGDAAALRALPIDHDVPPVDMAGGTEAAREALHAFVGTKLARYGDDHNHPDADATSRLSPYLHFGHISSHEVFSAVMTHERWTTRKINRTRAGAREGWWGVSPSAEHFLDQLVVWRELAFNTCEYVPDYASYASLPEWSRATLAAHRRDKRPHLYTIEQLATARTADPVWNAAMRQLLVEGWFHGYLRMLWGKKILEWSKTPEEALERMQILMDRYSLDGRDPNSYAGYAWVLGRYDRPWPEHEIFGTVRYMTSASAARKLKLKQYLATYGEEEPQGGLFE